MRTQRKPQSPSVFVHTNPWPQTFRQNLFDSAQRKRPAPLLGLRNDSQVGLRRLPASGVFLLGFLV